MRHNGNIASLTGIRGIAALWVLLYHVQSFSPEFGLAFLGRIPLLELGWSGVDLFFLLFCPLRRLLCKTPCRLFSEA